MIRRARRCCRGTYGGRLRRPSLVPALALVVLAFVLAAPGAAAVKGWCKTDPVIMVDGQIADVFVSAPLYAPLKVTGPTQIVVTVPVGVDAWLVASDLGFGRGEVVTFAESSDLQRTATGVEVEVAVYVPATTAMPVRVEFAARLLGILAPAWAEGTANAWVSLKTTA
jgi:hypothetical protein